MDPVSVQAKLEVRSFTCSSDNSGYVKTWGRPWIRRSRSFKVTDLGTNGKPVYDFLSVRNSNLGPVSHRFEDIAVFCPTGWPHPYSTPIFGMFPLHQIAHVGVSSSRGLTLFGREIIFEVFQPMYSQTIYDVITALLESAQHRAEKKTKAK